MSQLVGGGESLLLRAGQIYLIIPDFPISLKATFDNMQLKKQMGRVLQMLEFAQV